MTQYQQYKSSPQSKSSSTHNAHIHQIYNWIAKVFLTGIVYEFSTMKKKKFAKNWKVKAFWCVALRALKVSKSIDVEKHSSLDRLKKKNTYTHTPEKHTHARKSSNEILFSIINFNSSSLKPQRPWIHEFWWNKTIKMICVEIIKIFNINFFIMIIDLRCRLNGWT